MTKKIVSNCIKTFLYPTVSNAQNTPTPVVCCEKNRLDRTFRKPVSMISTWSARDQHLVDKRRSRHRPQSWHRLTRLGSYPGFGIRCFRRWLLIGISRFNTRHQRWLESLKRRLSALRSVLVFYSNEYSTRFENLHVREHEHEHEHEYVTAGTEPI
jgi:hypothetical protein